MKRIFQLLGRRWKACLVIVALLLLQAWCDLSLPGYTSDIVDVGIQMGGIESTVPETVRTDTLQALEWLMPQEDAQQAEADHRHHRVHRLRQEHPAEPDPLLL